MTRRGRQIRALALLLGFALVIGGAVGATASTALVDGWTFLVVGGALVLIFTLWASEGTRR